jgi:hypothetical protein
MGKISAHVQEYIGRYVVIASIVLVPLAGIVGDVAATVGPDTALGHTLLSVASALGTAAAIVVWLRNRGLFESAPLVAQAQAEATVAAVSVATLQSGSATGLDTLPPLEDPEAERVPAGDLPSDAEELAAPPPEGSMGGQVHP